MNKKIVFLVGHFLLAMPLCGMEQQKPLTLFQCFGIGEGTPKGVQNMIAARIVGPGGWWYKKLTLPHLCVKSIAFHPEGKMIGTAACGDHNAYLWDCEGNQLRTLTHDDSVRGIAFHPKGIMIGTACGDRNAYLWDCKGKELRRLPHNGFVNGIAIHPDGKMIGTVCFLNRNAYLWDCGGNELRRLPHNCCVRGIAFHPKGTMIITACDDGNAYLWDCEGKKLKMLPHNCYVNGIAFHPSGTMIGTACDYEENVYLWDCEGNLLRRLSHNDWVYGFTFHPKGKMIGTACYGNAYLWDCEGNKLKILPHNDCVNGIAFHPSGTMIGTVCDDYKAYLWQNYSKPTLKQVLFRLVLKNYFKECVACKQKPDNFAVEGANFLQTIWYWLFGAESIASQTLVPWMAEKFNLDETELTEVWQSFPPIMREAIARTVIYRSGAIACEDE